jgi:hypothetical protein
MLRLKFPLFLLFLTTFFLLSTNFAIADTGYLDPNGVGTTYAPITANTCASSLLSDCVDDAVRSPTTPSTTNDWLSLGAQTYSYFNMTNITNAYNTTQITVYVYHQEGGNSIATDISLYDTNETTTYGTAVRLPYRATAQWDTATFTGLNLTQTQLDNLKIYTYCYKVNKPYNCNLYAFYAAVTYTPPPPVSISLTTNGNINFGNMGLGSNNNTTPTGVNDPEIISVDTGPVRLDIKSSSFDNGLGHQLQLGSNPGAETVQWQFSPNGSAWTNFSLSDTLYTLSSNLATGTTQPVFFKLFTPTTTNSFTTHSSNITIVASAP